MGSRPPRHHTLPKSRPRQPRSVPNHQPAQTGLRMEAVAIFIGFAIFPVALGASGVAYLARQEITDVATAVILTIVVGLVAAVFARSRRQWRRDARMSNELLLAMLIGTIGVTFLIGGIAAMSSIWIVVGVAVLAGAILVGRTAKPTTR
ncbi:MAG TPA: hypothetical protein VGR22_05345 [Thermomicrobiales bacterium]|nr:hypothetical protein [Thermomicrobiales bacterium]